MHGRHKRQWCADALARAALRAGRHFCLQTSMHGFRHIAEPGRHVAERFVWVVATCLAAWGAVHVSRGQLQRYNESPTVVTLEKDFRSWQFSLPGITACLKNRVDPIKLQAAIRERWGVGPADRAYGHYARFAAAVADSDLLHLDSYREFKDDDELDVDLFQLAVDVMPALDIKTSTSERVVPRWTPVMTEFGVCHSTNSLAMDDVAIVPPNPNDTALFPIKCKYGEVLCHILMEVSSPYTNFYFHSAYDVVEVTAAATAVPIGTKRMIELSVTETGCGRGVHALTPARRACRFTHEPTHARRKVYSTNSCRLTCRSKMALKLCGCMPFYYFYEAGPFCNASGMWCLSRQAAALGSLAGAPCRCAAQCLSALYRQSNVVDFHWTAGPFAAEGSCRFAVPPPKVRYTREIVFHFQDLIVSFGGAAGLFLGASFISFVEVLYFALEKLLHAASPHNHGPDKEGRTQRANPMSFEEHRISELTKILHVQPAGGIRNAGYI